MQYLGRIYRGGDRAGGSHGVVAIVTDVYLCTYISDC